MNSSIFLLDRDIKMIPGFKTTPEVIYDLPNAYISKNLNKERKHLVYLAYATALGEDNANIREVIRKCYLNNGGSYNELKDYWLENSGNGVTIFDNFFYEMLIKYCIEKSDDMSYLINAYEEWYQKEYHITYNLVHANSDLISDFYDVFYDDDLKKSSLVPDEEVIAKRCGEKCGKFIFSIAERTIQLLKSGDYAESYGLFLILFEIDVRSFSTLIPLKLIELTYDYENFNFKTYTTQDNTVALAEYTDWTDDFFKSKQYSIYVNKVRNSIIEYLHVENWEQAIQEISESVAKDAYGLCICSSLASLAKNGSLCNNSYALYTPNAELIDNIVNIYCESRITNFFISKIKEKKPKEKYEISKLEITRFELEDPKYVIKSVIDYAYEYVVMDSYNDLLFAAGSTAIDYEAVEENTKKALQIENAELKAQVSDLKNKKDTAQKIDISNETKKKYDYQLSAKDKEIERLKSEIQKMQTTIASKDDYIELLEAAENEICDSADISQLAGKKFLFVGDSNTHMKYLKQSFPDSSYMTTSNFVLDNVQVDAVVFLVKCLSHSMYYKAKTYANLTNTKVIYFNNHNIDTLSKVIAAQL